ncbi:MAG: DMT family transporter [Candidatus Rokubacteria bacterium]|jgi:drug/metabolite transporter (DMT)-like permease|nr:DMT family transporter [Candidatus Rokubacteria bacterium]
MGWVGWSIVALVCWGVWAVLNKLALRSLDWGHLLVASWLIYTGAVVVLLAARLDPRALVSRNGLIAVAAALTSLVAVTSFYLALRSGPVATVTPLSSLYPAVAVVLAVLLLRENPSPLQWAGVALAIVAGILLTRP